ncbi:ABC transporter substrate-binding protein [Biostraticola tofi]|uniref:NitT/TauT family transport system substrate-binding protein n=1 Tax=Biostraticola tofi TaxID=466109 RepID=A0A4V2W5K5_9GAMM|nr:ABC transporter substrate-binding protein [Biostraticola tofi]TCW00136.1 NitT/TauT family transport system substrate-binding protein [Biostraticola tofi]
MKKRMIAATLAAGMLLSLSAAAADKVRIGYWTSGVSLGYGAVLESQDFLAKRGIEAEFVHFPNVNGPLSALASGSIDLAFGAPLAGVFSSASEGVPLKIFAATQPADVQFVVPADSPISQLSQLKGKKIGMSPAGSSVAVIASTILQQNAGIQPSDFSLVGGNESRLAQFLAQKQVDGAALRSVTISQLTELKVKSIGSFAEEWQKLTHSAAVPYIGVGAVSGKLAQENPQAIAKVIAALRDTLAWGKSHPAEVVAILQKQANLPKHDAEVYVSRWDSMNRLVFEPADIDTLKRQHRVFLDSGAIKGTLDDALFDTGPYLAAKSIR